jgi:hypothetical protein
MKILERQSASSLTGTGVLVFCAASAAILYVAISSWIHFRQDHAFPWLLIGASAPLLAIALRKYLTLRRSRPETEAKRLP